MAYGPLTVFDGLVATSSQNQVGALPLALSACAGAFIATPARAAEELTSYQGRLEAGKLDSRAMLWGGRLTRETTASEIRELARAGAAALTLAPEDIPCGRKPNFNLAPAWVEKYDLSCFRQALKEMGASGVRLVIHCEHMGKPPFRREVAFLPYVEQLVERHPRLKVAIDSVSTTQALKVIEECGVWGAIRPIHLRYSWSDLYHHNGACRDPRLVCQPSLQANCQVRPCLVRAAAQSERVFYASGFRPESPLSEEVALSLVASAFRQYGLMGYIGDFLARGANFFGAKTAPYDHDDHVFLVGQSPTVPSQSGGFVPPLAGESLGWRVIRYHDIQPQLFYGI